MEARMASGSVTKPLALRYAAGTYLGLTYADPKCPGSPGDARALARELAARGLCGASRFDYHITPDARGVPELVNTARNLSAMLGEEACDELKLVVLEQNMCSGGERCAIIRETRLSLVRARERGAFREREESVATAERRARLARGSR